MSNTLMPENDPDQTPDTDAADTQTETPGGIPGPKRRPARKQVRKKKTRPLRLFLGLGFPLYEKLAPLHEDLNKLATEEPSMRVAPAANLHITLKFLGALKPEQVTEIHALCAPICARYQTMEIQSKGIGVFKNSLWVGIAKHETLTALASELNEAGRLLGVADEAKDFMPHVTVARFGKVARPQLSPLLEKYQNTEWGNFSALKCYLYQSETLQEGARYSILQGYPFAEAGEPIDNSDDIKSD